MIRGIGGAEALILFECGETTDRTEERVRGIRICVAPGMAFEAYFKFIIRSPAGIINPDTAQRPTDDRPGNNGGNAERIERRILPTGAVWVVAVDTLDMFYGIGERQTLLYRMQFVVILDRMTVAIIEAAPYIGIGCAVVTRQGTGSLFRGTSVEGGMAGRAVRQVAADAAVCPDQIGK